MKRSGFRSNVVKFAPKPAKVIEYTPRARTVEGPAGLVSAVLASGPARASVMPKTAGRKDQRIRDSARGEVCTIRLPGCDGGGATTVWCHLPEAVADRGLGIKGIDALGAYGCASCHDIVDRRADPPEGYTLDAVALAFYRALARSFVILKRKGLA